MSVKYLQILLDRSRVDDLKDRQRLDLQFAKIVGKFHQKISKIIIKLIDQYHQSTSHKLDTYEEGPLKITFMVEGASEEVIEGANIWLRQELNAATWISSHYKLPLLIPLMTVAEYKGFRCYATLVLPLTEKTLVMDGQGAGSIMTEEGALNAANTLGEMLNLTTSSSTALTSKQSSCCLPSTVEIHRLTNTSNNKTMMLLSMPEGMKSPFNSNKGNNNSNKYPAGLYMLNLHDIIPAYPQMSTSDSSGDSAGGRESLLYFRPELIQSLPKPFCAATEGLSALRVVKEDRMNEFLTKLESITLLPLDSEEWRVEMHKSGLNIALMGQLAKMTRLPHVREGLVCEMIARSLKFILRQRLRSTILHFKEVQALRVEEELREIFIEMVNSVIDVVCEGGKEEFNELAVEVLEVMYDRFGYSLLDRRAGQVKICRNALLMAIEHHCAVNLAESVYVCSQKSSSSKESWQPLTKESVKSFRVILGHGGEGMASFPLHQSSQLQELIGKALLPVSNLKQHKGKRAMAAKILLQMSQEEADIPDQARKYAEIAAGLCPPHHPLQSLISIQLLQVKANLLRRGKEVGGTEGNVANLLKAREGLLKKISNHFGLNHPLSLIITDKIATLLRECESGLILRDEVTTNSIKILGRRHSKTLDYMESLAKLQYSLQKHHLAINTFGNVIKVYNEYNEGRECNKKEHNERICSLLMGQMKCWECIGDYEAALQLAQESVKVIENESDNVNNESGTLWEEGMQAIAKYAQLIFSNIEESSGKSVMMITDSLKFEELTSNDISSLPQRISFLSLAASCYEKLFDARRKRELTAKEGEAILHLARKIVYLELCQAKPAQRPLLKSALRRKLLSQPEDHQLIRKEAAVRDLLVRLVAGPVSPREMTQKILGKCEVVECLVEAESELLLLLDLIQL